MGEADLIKSEKQSECPICGSKGEYVFQNLKDRLYGKSEGWNLRKCTSPECKLIWMDPMPMKEEIWKAYINYYTHSEQKRSFFYNEFLARTYFSLRYGYYPEYSPLKRLLGLIVYLNPLMKVEADFNVLYLPRISNGKILDYGCGNGWLLSNLRQLGWETYGMDFDDKAIEYCQSVGLNVSRPDLEQFPDSYFDAITINHVIEHLHDFDKLLRQCHMKLKSGGKIVIATPNTDSWLLKRYKSNWMQLDPPRHLQLFNLKNLSGLLSQTGFKIRKLTSSFRIDAWTIIVSRDIWRKGYFKHGENKKKKVDVATGVLYQAITSFLLFFNKKLGDEIILKAEKI